MHISKISMAVEPIGGSKITHDGHKKDLFQSTIMFTTPSKIDLDELTAYLEEFEPTNTDDLAKKAEELRIAHEHFGHKSKDEIKAELDIIYITNKGSNADGFSNDKVLIKVWPVRYSVGIEILRNVFGVYYTPPTGATPDLAVCVTERSDEQ